MISRPVLSGVLLFAAVSAFATTGTLSPTAGGLPNPNYGALRKLDLSRLPVGAQGKRVVARVNGRPISEDRFNKAVNRAVRAQGKLPPEQAEAMRAAIAAPVLDDLLKSELVLEYAEKHGLTATEDDISRALKAANDQLPPGRKLQDEAIARGEAPEGLRDDIRERLLQDKVIEHLGRDVMPAPPEVEAELMRQVRESAGQGRGTSVTEVRARHIVFRSRDDSPTTEVERARVAAEKVLALIRGGMDFGQAARRYSQDRTTRDLDGDLGFFARGRMYPDFDKIAFTLKPGEISEVIRTPVGFHIIQVTDRREGGVQHNYQEYQRRRRFSEWLDKAFRQAKVEKYL